MRINENSPISGVEDLGPGRAKPTSKPEKNAAEDQVKISSTAKELSNAPDAARQQKIEALKRAFESGTYRVEPDKVAGAMVRSLLGETEEK